MHSLGKLVQKSVWLMNYVLFVIVFSIFYKFRVYVHKDIFKVKSPVIIAPNHQGRLDPWIIVIAMPFAVFRHLLPIRYMGTTYYNSQVINFLEAIGIMPLIHFIYGVIRIERGRTKHEKIVPFAEALEDGDTVGIFVEGSLAEPGKLAPIKDGVAMLQKDTGVSVLPIAIRYGKPKLFRRLCTISYGAPIPADTSLSITETKQRIENQLRILFES